MKIIELKSGSMCVSISNLGARILGWQTLVNGSYRPIVLQYNNEGDYLSDRFYLGAIVGPYANRIKNGRVNIKEDKVLHLNCNEGLNHLHGGKNAIDKQTWQIVYSSQSAVLLELVIQDMWNGYPGALELKAEYTLENQQLRLRLSAQSEKDTVVGMSAHSYFNLNGTNSHRNGLEQWLSTSATHVNTTDMYGLPNRPAQPIRHTQYDYSTRQLLAQQKGAEVLDNNFIFSNPHSETILESFDRDLKLSVSSDYPAMQIYTGGHLREPFYKNQSVCIEPQFGPDMPNCKTHPLGLLPANTLQQHTINYTVTTD
ncbi:MULTISPECIES: aldose epimerase family protein [Alteromonas]|jgi:aldose 1-epimerase|uniref:aldose epimerase family protein n=1 Tax=Alteromonas TaxID=226 RepID=UPI002356470D|nr:aldose epimerase [Alteromonas australica]|tara:strand:- start:7669 stop:8607 length:939 start_codon:yes stop_codon:yes gene_type:complete